MTEQPPGNQRLSVLPARALDDDGLPDRAFRVLALLGIYGDKAGWCWPAIPTLAARLKSSDRHIQRALRDLEARGYLERHGRIGQSNKFRIIFDGPACGDCSVTGAQSVGGDRTVTGDNTLSPGGDSQGVTRGVTASGHPERPIERPKERPTQRLASKSMRLPESWEPDCNLVAWCEGTLPGFDWRSETEVFKDHWRGAAGSRGVKADWPATWRNWMRRSANGFGQRNGASPPKSRAQNRAEIRAKLEGIKAS